MRDGREQITSLKSVKKLQLVQRIIRFDDCVNNEFSSPEMFYAKINESSHGKTPITLVILLNYVDVAKDCLAHLYGAY